jgi:AmmeMemoRadiSam system protein A
VNRHPAILVFLVFVPLVLALCAVATGCFSRTRRESEASVEASAKATPPVPAAAREDPNPTNARALGVEDQRRLLMLARSGLRTAARDNSLLATPSGLPASLTERKGCFVTLTIKGGLRGCIGNIFPDKPLAEAVIQNAYNAALNDPRFSPVTPNELSAIEVEVSVLTVPAPLGFASPDDLLHKLRPHVDGVVLNISGRRATFLPQVWEQLPDATEFLGQLSVKAGLSRDAWRDKGTRVQVYQVQAFKESNSNLVP